MRGTLPGLRFPTVREASLAEKWYHSAPFARFRGTAWMAEPCRSCERREIEGGCRCQALALTGDSARNDPACALSADHALLAGAARLKKRDPISSTARISPHRRDCPSPNSRQPCGERPGT